MNLKHDALILQRELRRLSSAPEWRLLSRYDLLRNKPSPSLFDSLYKRLRLTLAWLGLMPPHLSRYDWQPTLKHVPKSTEYRPLLIWALGVERDVLRQSCDGFSRLLRNPKGWAPILVTDVADFAYYSRLGWLVEYLPALSGSGQSYQERKRRYLAWRYRDALAVPPSAGLANQSDWDDFVKEAGKNDR